MIGGCGGAAADDRTDGAGAPSHVGRSSRAGRGRAGDKECQDVMTSPAFAGSIPVQLFRCDDDTSRIGGRMEPRTS